MLKEEFMASMQRILALFVQPKSEGQAKERAEYLDALYESMCLWDAGVFDRVCQRVVNQIGPKSKKPMPLQFHAVKDVLVREDQTILERASRRNQKSEEESDPYEMDEGFLAKIKNTMDPRGAQWILENMTEKGPRFSKRVMDALLEKSCEADEADTDGAGAGSGDVEDGVLRPDGVGGRDRNGKAEGEPEQAGEDLPDVQEGENAGRQISTGNDCD